MCIALKQDSRINLKHLVKIRRLQNTCMNKLESAHDVHYMLMWSNYSHSYIISPQLN